MANFKVFHVINGLWPGGAQIMLLRLCEEFARHEVQSEVFSLTKADTIKPQLEAIGVKCHQGNILDLRRVLKESSPDVVQGWMYHSNLAIAGATVFSGLFKRQFWSVHHSIEDMSLEKFTSQIVIRLLSLISKLPKKTVYVSEVSKHQHTKLGFCKDNAVQISNGYDLELFKKDASLRETFRNELEISDSSFLIGILGRFHFLKDHKMFLDAAALFASKHDNCGFIIAGRDTTNTQITDWITERGLSDRVMVLGDRRDVSAILNGIDILATSSISEAFPIVIGEAMACETVCCSTHVGDTEILIGERDLLSLPGDPVALFESWWRVANLSSKAREDLGKKLRTRIREKFSLSIIAEKYLSLYEVNEDEAAGE